MQWWCSAQSTAWTWTWQPYVGVWLLVALGIWWYRRLRGGWFRDRQSLWFGLGLLCLWTALDWPVGPLGSSYLVSVHMGQFLLVGLLAPLLLLAGLPDEVFHRIRRDGAWYGFLETATHPVIAFLVFNAVITVTHWPGVVDAMMVSQAGSFVLDMAWLAGGLIYWWPMVAPVPARPRFIPLAQLGYLAFNIVLIRPPMLIMFYSEFPVYSVYELAPPLLPGSSAVEDQQLAAGIMKVGSAWILAVAMLVVFLRWYRASRSESHAA